jgi:hypothetical protein
VTTPETTGVASAAVSSGARNERAAFMGLTALRTSLTLSSASLMPVPSRDCLKSRMPFPSCRPISGSLFGPKRRRATTPRRMISIGPMLPIAP